MRVPLAMVCLLIATAACARPALESSFELWEGGAAVGWAGEGLAHSADARTGDSALRVNLLPAPRGGHRGLVYASDLPRVVTTRHAWLEWIAWHDTIPFGSEQTARTPLKCVLYAPPAASGTAHDRWTRVHGCVHDRFASTCIC